MHICIHAKIEFTSCVVIYSGMHYKIRKLKKEIIKTAVVITLMFGFYYAIRFAKEHTYLESLAAVTAAAIVARVFWLRAARRRRGRWRSRNSEVIYPASIPAGTLGEDGDDEAEADGAARYERQLALVQGASNIKAAAIFNTGETEIFYGAGRALREVFPGSGWSLHGQVSLGELMETACSDCERVPRQFLPDRIEHCSRCRQTYGAFNAKRIDLVICDNAGVPRLAIEHQGAGHIDRSSPERERQSLLRNDVKKQALASAGIRLLETDRGMRREEAQALIARELRALREEDAALGEDREKASSS